MRQRGFRISFNGALVYAAATIYVSFPMIGTTVFLPVHAVFATLEDSRVRRIYIYIYIYIILHAAWAGCS